MWKLSSSAWCGTMTVGVRAECLRRGVSTFRLNYSWTVDEMDFLRGCVLLS